MRKSEEREKLESQIESAHTKAIEIAMQMVQEEFGGRVDDALIDQSFIIRMQNKIREFWEIYRNEYGKLEDLELKEGYPAMLAYASELDVIAEHLPLKNRYFCYYPFSGVDFYWMRIFKKVVFEDNAFYEQDKSSDTLNIWWSIDTYGAKKRHEIISTLMKLEIISSMTDAEFLSKDVETCKDSKRFNGYQSTLLMKGGSDVLAYLEKQFADDSLKYGAVIIGSAVNSIRDMEERFTRDGYYRHFSLEGDDFLAPYAMKLKDIHIFLKDG
jgi:hypothetical protein